MQVKLLLPAAAGMRSLPRVLKAAEVYIDQDNTVQIKAPAPVIAGPEETETEIETENEIFEKAPEDLIKKAEEEAAFILRKAEIESQNMLTKAKEEAAFLTEETRIRLEEEKHQIHEESRQEGYTQGIEEATAKGNDIKAEAQAVLDDAVRERDETLKAIEPAAVNLIIDILEKLLGNAVKINPAVIVALIRKGFADANLSGQVTVRVSESDYPEVMACKEELIGAIGGTAEIEIVRDLSLEPTNCIIDTPFGGIDVSLTSQFEALKADLLFLLQNQG